MEFMDFQLYSLAAALVFNKIAASGTAVLKHPLVLGHEIAGRIVALGDGVAGLALGDAVTVHPSQPVGDEPLPERLAGRSNLYPEIRYFGSAAFDPHTDGGFSDLRAVSAQMIRVLPDGVDTLNGALAEPFAVALHAVNRVGDVRGKHVLVNGAGTIGSLVVAAALYRGAASVTAADIQDSALEMAKSLGAATTLNVANGDTLPTDAEVVFETSGASGVLGSVLKSTARSAFASGLDVSAIVTHRFPLAKAVTAMRVAPDRSTGSSKVMLDLSAE